MFKDFFTSRLFGLLVFITSIFLILPGCATKQVVVQYDQLLVTPENHLIANCEVAAPPSKDAYLGTVAEQDFTIARAEKDPAIAKLLRSLENASRKEKLLIIYSGELLKNLQLCNKRLEGLRDWKVKSEKAVLSKSPTANKRKKE